jgi:RNA-directed DNA polymerase
LKRKRKEKKMIGLLKKIIQNFDKEKGMPLGNMTSQFFANVYLNELDYVIKHTLRLKYYIKYVDDFIIFHRNKRVLEECKEKIEKYLININLELHPEKSKITALHKGINFLGFRCFYFHKCIQKRNMSRLYKRIPSLKKLYGQEYITADRLTESIEGWCAYALLGNTYRLRKRLKRKVKNLITS